MPDALAQGPCYQVTHIIQAPPCQWTGPPPTTATAISPNGLYVSGYWRHCSNPSYYRAFVYRTDTHQFITLPLPPGTASSYASDVTDDGLVVGAAGDGEQDRTGFMYNIASGQFTLLTAAVSNGPCEISAINSSGTVCGTRAIGGAPINWLTSAFTWSPQTGYVDLGAISGYDTSAADLNDAGAVCGRMVVGNVYGVFLWRNGQITDLGSLYGLESWAFAISENNEVVGNSWMPYPGHPYGVPRPFLWTNGAMSELPIVPGHYIGAAIGISGDIAVGTSRSEAGADAALLWHNGTMYELAALIEPGPNLFIYAVAITPGRTIIANGYDAQFRNVAFVLTPAPARLGDVDGDCRTNVNDLLIVIHEWGQTKSIADLNQDGIVNLLDLVIVIENWTFG